MTIDTTKPSRAFDAWIAENVMGWMHSDLGKLGLWDLSGIKLWKRLDGKARSYLPHYTTDIAAAWKVVEAMPKFKLRVTITQNEDGYTVELWHPNGKSAYPGYTEGDSVALAICQAAYKALTPSVSATP